MKESTVETYLRKQVKEKLGGWALKFVSPGLRGVPDRLILLPNGRVVFVETKAPGKDLRTLQKYVCGQIAGLWFDVRKIDRKAQVDKLIEEVGRGGV